MFKLKKSQDSHKKHAHPYQSITMFNIFTGSKKGF